MFIRNRNIEFTVIYLGEEHRVQTWWGEYKTLRFLLSDKLNISRFGECGGMGRCATCLIEISNLNGSTTLLKRSEHTSMQRMIKSYSIVRFACQVQVNDDLANVTIKILKNDRPS
jgi:ferredoxin, 2Fe-2S